MKPESIDTCEVLGKVTLTGDVLSVDLTGKNGGKVLALNLADRWIGLGFSEDGGMAKTPVVHCFTEAGKAVSKLTFNSEVGFANEGFANISQNQLTPLKSAIDGTSLSCSVNLQRKISIKAFTFDLAATKHSLLVATGPLKQGTTPPIQMHDKDPDTSHPEYFLF